MSIRDLFGLHTATSVDRRVQLRIKAGLFGRVKWLEMHDEVTGAVWSLDVNAIDGLDEILGSYNDGGYPAMTDALRKYGATLVVKG